MKIAVVLLLLRWFCEDADHGQKHEKIKLPGGTRAYLLELVNKPQGVYQIQCRQNNITIAYSSVVLIQ